MRIHGMRVGDLTVGKSCHRFVTLGARGFFFLLLAAKIERRSCDRDEREKTLCTWQLRISLPRVQIVNSVADWCSNLVPDLSE